MTHSKSTFSEGHIMARRGCCHLKFLDMPDNGSGLLGKIRHTKILRENVIVRKIYEKVSESLHIM